MLDRAQLEKPLYSDTFLTEALEDLDGLGDSTDVAIGPFTAFRFRTLSLDYGHDIQYNSSEIDRPWSPIHAASAGETESAPDNEYPSSGSEDDAAAHGLEIRLRVVIQPLLPHYLASATAIERRMFHYWITCLSDLYLPIATIDNPYRNILIPLALKATTTSDELSGNAALLHAIYSITASHWAQRTPNQISLQSFAAKNYNASLTLLRKSLVQQNGRQRNAILAAVILLSTMECFTGVPHGWRVHVKGGRQWLRQQGNYWIQDPEAIVLCQMFECIEVVGDTQTIGSSMAQRDEISSEVAHDSESTRGSGYCLDRYLGIPKPVFDAIREVNRLRNWGRVLELDEITELEAIILITKPTSLFISSTAISEDKHRYHYSWAYHHACRVYFEREIRSTPPDVLQKQVREGLFHFEQINDLERSRDVCGLLWPIFVLACEAQRPDLRQRFTTIFGHAEMLGIGNSQKAAQAIRQVWRQNDGERIVTTADRWKTLLHLGFDLLLT